MKSQKPTSSNNLSYRPDIDGLRAIAVFAVFIFHAFPKYMKGGFVGVDVFFVISGFLISSIIFKQLINENFSFWNFYSRRIRRIYPTLITVLLACLVFGWFYLLNDDYALLGKHITGGAGFVSNFILWFESGYFDVSSHYKPLLHLWSLGIEEQFYIIWPLLLWSSWKKKFNLFTVCLVLAVISFGWNLYWYKTNSVADYFSPQTRFWELLCGAMLAWANLQWHEKFQSIKNKLNGIIAHRISFDKEGQHLVNNLLSIVGFILLIASVFVIKSSRFPGKIALLPVAATIMIIAAGANSYLNKKILSNNLLVWFGLISYPMYLWHWPILSMSRIVLREEPPVWWLIVAFFLCVVFSWLTTKFIEAPLRFGERGKLKTIGLFLTVLILGTVGFSIYKMNGVPSRFSVCVEEQKFNEPFDEYVDESKKRCDSVFSDWQKYTDNACMLQKPSGENTIALIGDSHAGHLFAGMSFIDKKEGIAVFPASCAAPFLGISSGTNHYQAVRKDAFKLIQRAYDYIIKDSNIKIVVLGHYPNCSYGDGALDRLSPNEKDVDKILENGMRRTLDVLAKSNKKVLFVLDNPSLPFEPQKVYNPFPFAKKTDGTFPRFSSRNQNVSREKYNQLVKRVTIDYQNVAIVDLADVLCDGETCYSVKDDWLLYKDTNHLNYRGSTLVAPFIMDAIQNLQKR